MNEARLQGLGDEAQRILDSEVFRAAEGAATQLAEQHLEAAKTAEEAWLAVQERRAIRNLLAYLEICIVQGKNVANKRLRRRRFEQEAQEMAEARAAYQKNAEAARKEFEEGLRSVG